MGRLQEKVAVITGASSGIGRAIAIGFANEGARIVCSDIRSDARPEGYDADTQRATAEVIEAQGSQACFDRRLSALAGLTSWSIMPVCSRV